MNNSKNIAIALLALAEEGINADKIAKDFQTYLEHHKLLAQLPEIVRQMEKLNDARNKFEEVEIQTAHATSKELLTKIRDHINAPKDAKIENKLNTNLIGGFIAKYKGVEFDTSLKTQLKKLQESLITA
jgi:F-type H+-transporting ATPase subunit delta